MSQQLVRCNGLALLLLFGFAVRPALASDATQPPWETDYAKARNLARVLGKPLFVVFRCER
jgi:hypothetical protein